MEKKLNSLYVQKEKLLNKLKFFESDSDDNEVKRKNLINTFLMIEEVENNASLNIHYENKEGKEEIKTLKVSDIKLRINLLNQILYELNEAGASDFKEFFELNEEKIDLEFILQEFRTNHKFELKESKKEE
jgi:hypothetical protein